MSFQRPGIDWFESVVPRLHTFDRENQELMSFLLSPWWVDLKEILRVIITLERELTTLSRTSVQSTQLRIRTVGAKNKQLLKWWLAHPRSTATRR